MTDPKQVNEAPNPEPPKEKVVRLTLFHPDRSSFIYAIKRLFGLTTAADTEARLLKAIEILVIQLDSHREAIERLGVWCDTESKIVVDLSKLTETVRENQKLMSTIMLSMVRGDLKEEPKADE